MDQYKQVNHLFWQGSAFQYIFYISILLVLILENRKMHKTVFGFFPLVMIIGVFNPFTARIVGLFFRDPNRYYVRLFSVIPVFYCMAYGVTLLLKKTHGMVKLTGVCIAVGLIIITGHSIYQEPWMQRATNLMKAPDEVKMVLEAIPREKQNVRVAFPNPLYLYARQIDASILMPYGRQEYSNELLDELNKHVPDVPKTMKRAGIESVDYVIVNKNEEARAAFSDYGYEPVSETDGYYVYHVEGVHFIDMALNDKRQIISTTECDSNGIPTYGDTRVMTSIVYQYDKWGNQTKEEYYNRNGQRMTTLGGYSGYTREYKLHGLSWAVDSIKHYDERNQLMLVSGRYETRYDYLKGKELIKERYYNENGEIMDRLDTGYAMDLKKYNRSNQIVSEKFFDASGSAVLSSEGYAEYRREYDPYGHISIEKYYDTKGESINNTSGFAEWDRTYDEFGNTIEEVFMDNLGRRVDVKGRVIRDDTGNLLDKMQKNSIKNCVGLEYDWQEDGSCRITGATQGISWNTLYNGDRPFFLFNGETYCLQYTSERVHFIISFYEDSTWKNELISPVKALSDTEFTIPQNCGAISICLWVDAGTQVNETVYPQLYIKHDAI